MKPARGLLNTLAILAIFLVLGSGLVASAAPSPGDQPSGSQGWQAPDQGGGGLSFALTPTPLYLHQDMPSDYPFKQGGALVLVTGDTLQVRTSFQAAQGATFSIVLQTAGQNITVGHTATGRDGQGQFQGNVSLSPGAYGIGILVFSAGPNPVAVSVPRSLQVELSGGSQASSTTTASTTSESSSVESQPGGSASAGQIQLVPSNSSSPRGEDRPSGRGGYSVLGGNVTFNLAFSGQTPASVFSVVLTVNGSSRSIGNYTTDSDGAGSIDASAALGTGVFSLGLEVVALRGLATPTTVLVSSPTTFTVQAVSFSTSGQSPPPESTNSTVDARGPVWTFQLKPSPKAAAPEGYRFAESGTAVVSVQSRGPPALGVELSISGANPSTSYYADLVLNGSDLSLGSMTTNRLGDVALRSSVQVAPGTYMLGLAVYDASNSEEFHQASPVLVMVSDPASQLAIVGQAGTANTSTASSTSYGSSTSEVVKAVTTQSAGSEVEGQIRNALNFTIPAAVQVTPLNSYSSVYDSRFSLSVGQQGGNGLVIAISGENVTGPRVLLINMSRTDPLALYPSLSVTLDGSPVQEASSALQVLNPVSTDPPYYVVIGTSASLQLLVSIPHFSLHLIQVAGVVVSSAVHSLEVDSPILLGSVLVITVVFAAVYGARKRYSTVI